MVTNKVIGGQVGQALQNAGEMRGNSRLLHNTYEISPLFTTILGGACMGYTILTNLHCRCLTRVVQQTYLTGSFVSTHLQADSGLVIRLVCLCLWVIKMSPGAISSHTSLACTFVSSHLKILANDYFVHIYART